MAGGLTERAVRAHGAVGSDEKDALAAYGSPDRLDLFVAGWKSSIERTARLLRDPARTEFVPVTIAEPLSVSETVALFHDLQCRKMPVSELVVNQLHLECACPNCLAAASADGHGALPATMAPRSTPASVRPRAKASDLA